MRDIRQRIVSEASLTPGGIHKWTGCAGVRQKLGDTRSSVTRSSLTQAIEVYHTLGSPGLLVSVYEQALAWELDQAGLAVRRQLDVPLKYKIQIATPLRIDLLVVDLVIVECKATSRYNEVIEARVLTYLRSMQLKLGVVFNFGEIYVKDFCIAS